jgi:hypothetical protein
LFSKALKYFDENMRKTILTQASSLLSSLNFSKDEKEELMNFVKANEDRMEVDTETQ